MIRLFDVGEVRSAVGRAIVEERYASLRRQIPVIYAMALVNLFGLQVATSGTFVLGFNPPTILVACALFRTIQWLWTGKSAVAHELMLKRMRQTVAIATAACMLVAVWCITLVLADASARLPVLLFGSLTAFGTAYGLSTLPAAARMPLLVLVFPLAVEAMLADGLGFVGAAISVVVVGFLLLRLIDTHNGHFVGLIQSRAVIAHERERVDSARREAADAARTDFLTGLPNRRAFIEAMDAALGECDGGFALALFDLDRFKPVNDTFGHAAGDELLRQVAARLRAASPAGTIVARLGGDEFALLLSDRADPSAASHRGERILASVNRIAEVHGRRFNVSACCGIAVAGAGESSLTVLARADIALYHAKAEGPGTLAQFTPAMELPRRRRGQIESALQLPDVSDDIELVFQPIVELDTGRIVAQEALARWTDAELGPVPPAEFVPLAEQLNVIGGLSDTLLRKALGEVARLPSSLRLSFNLSAVQLSSKGSADGMLAALAAARVAPSRLQVEVTETALLADFAQARDNLQRLRDEGVTIVLDDFGAGYASISYLREIEFDQIKLDGSLVTGSEQDPDRLRLLGAVIGLCRALGVEPVAEHVETEKQYRLLLRLGCRMGQGYWLQRPMKAEQACKLTAVPAIVAPTGSKPAKYAA